MNPNTAPENRRASSLNRQAMSFPDLDAAGALLGASCCTSVCELGGSVDDFDWGFDEFQQGLLPELPMEAEAKQAPPQPQPQQPAPKPKSAPCCASSGTASASPCCQRRSSCCSSSAGAGRTNWEALKAQLAQSSTGASSSGGGSSSTGLVVPVAADKKQYLAWPFCLTAKMGPELPAVATPQRPHQKRKRSSEEGQPQNKRGRVMSC